MLNKTCIILLLIDFKMMMINLRPGSELIRLNVTSTSFSREGGSCYPMFFPFGKFCFSFGEPKILLKKNHNITNGN